MTKESYTLEQVNQLMRWTIHEGKNTLTSYSFSILLRVIRNIDNNSPHFHNKSKDKFRKETN